MAHEVEDRTDYDTRDVGDRVTRDIDVLQVGRLGVLCEPLDKDGQHFRSGEVHDHLLEESHDVLAGDEEPNECSPVRLQHAE